jgi:hypothetical protein
MSSRIDEIINPRPESIVCTGFYKLKYVSETKSWNCVYMGDRNSVKDLIRQSTPAPSFQPSFGANPDTSANSLPIQPSFPNPSVSPEPPKNNSIVLIFDSNTLVIIGVVVVGVILLIVLLLIKNKME